MKKILLSPYTKLVKEHRTMWKTLRKKGVVKIPLLLYRALYIYKRWRARKLTVRTHKKTGRFLSLHIDVYSTCNRKCDFCFNHDRFPDKKQGVMSEAVWTKIIDELADMGYTGKLSPYYYGEPLLDKRLNTLIAYAKKRLPLCFIQINTNGDLLTEERLLGLIESGLDRVKVTDYENIGISKKVSESRISEQTKRLQYLAEKYPLFVYFRNWKEIHLMNRAGAIYKRKNPRKNEPCQRPSCQLIIDWQGNVILCCNDYYSEYKLGNVNEESIIDIWQKPRFKEYRRALESGKREAIKICAGCDCVGILDKNYVLW
jgi:radical SAM protein with 4Fe4S-binding SPASM domain